MMPNKEINETKCFWHTILFLNFFILLEAISLIAGIVFTWRTETVFSQLKLIFCIYAFVFFCNSILGIFGIKNKSAFVLFFAITLIICRAFFLVVVYFIIFYSEETMNFIHATLPDSYDYMEYILDVLKRFDEWPEIGYAIYLGITVVYVPIIFCYLTSLTKMKKAMQQRVREEER